MVGLRFIPLPTTSFIIQNRFENTFSDKSQTLYFEWVNYNKISNSMKLAVIAAEDQKFFTHFGFDFNAIQNAIEYNKENKRVRGASTISQQTAKNLFLWSGKSFFRKGLEAYFTLLLEIFWSKERILEVYLNVAQFGKNCFGVEAASKIFFYKNAKDISNIEAAQLASVLPNPNRYKVNSPTKFLKTKTKWIKKQMVQLGEGTLQNY